MSDLQPRRLPPSPGDASHAQFMRWRANEQNDEVSSADGSRASGSSVDEQSNEEFSTDESSDDGWRTFGLSADEQSDVEFSADELSDDGYSFTLQGWTFKRWRNALPLAISARIPLEVFEIIINAMNPPTLTVAALVCAAWHPRAMHNLYYDVKIHSRACYNMLFKQCRASPRVKQWLASTYKLLVHEGNYAPRFLQALPSALAGLMPRVRILHIRNARLRFIRTDFFLALSRFKSVKSLTLFACRLNNMTQLRRIVSAFPQLTDLTMQDVEFAQRGAPSYAGASLFRAPSHMRLRYLYVAVDDECMAMFLDWMTHSGLCNSLADVTVWFDNSRASMALTPLNQLLETAGASLTRFCERLYSNVNHGNLLQNTALQSLNIELELGSLRLTAQLQVPRAAWTKATDELHGTFSTIRSSQLEHIELEVNVEVDYYHSLLKSEEPSVVLEKLDLHEVMSQPYFDTLQDVKVKMRLVPSFLQTKSDEDSIAQKLQAMFHSILQPWSDRGIVTVTWQRLP